MTRAPLLLGIRFLRILWRMLPILFVSVNVALIPWLLDASDSIKLQATVAAVAIIVFRLVSAVVTEVLSPHRPGMRMVAVSDVRAYRLATVVRALLYVLLGAQLIVFIVRMNGWNESVASLVILLRDLGLVVFLALAVVRTGLLAKVDVPEVRGYFDVIRRFSARYLFPIVVLAQLGVITLRRLGYSAMADWVWHGVLGSCMAILVTRIAARFLKLRLHRAVSFIESDSVKGMSDEGESVVDVPEAAGDEADDDESAAVAEADPTWIGIERIGGGVISITAILALALWLGRVWGIEVHHVEAFFDRHVFALGGPTWGDLASAATALVVVAIVWKFVSTALIFIAFPRAEVDAGARYAILAILQYITWFVGGYLAFSSLGFDTSALTVFAGAFGVAVAFGLQDIFGNFLSGLIMLIERPVRVGDLIEVGTTSGRVEAIRLRGTTIRSFENTTIIIPNSQMLGERLKNLSHDMTYARVEVKVGVSYDADPRRVTDLLVRTARSDPRVLRDPKPFVRFQQFGASSLDFVLRCYTAQTGDRWLIGSDMHAAVLAALRRADIEIPFPKRDLYIKSDGADLAPDGSPTI